MFREYIFAILDWCKIIIGLEHKTRQVLFKEGEIWWCSIGMNVGVEIFGKGGDFGRPVIIFKKFNTNSFLGIPLTTKPKMGMWYIPFVYAGKRQYAIFSQIRNFDSKRLINKIGSLSTENFYGIKARFAVLYVPENTRPLSSSEGSDEGRGGKSQ